MVQHHQTEHQAIVEPDSDIVGREPHRTIGVQGFPVKDLSLPLQG